VQEESAEDVVARCLDFWAADLYTSGGVATPFAAKAILGELKLAGYELYPSFAEIQRRVCRNPQH
jgi:hypothetical protein